MQGVKHSARGGVVSVQMPKTEDCWLELELHSSARLEVTGWRGSGRHHKLVLALTVTDDEAKLDLSGIGECTFYGTEPSVVAGRRFLITISTIDGGQSFSVVTESEYLVEES